MPLDRISSGIDKCTDVSKLLVGLLETASPGAVYNAISVSSNCCQAPHRDTNNMISIPNRLVPLVMPKSGGDLWVEIRQGDELVGEVVVKEVQPGKQVAGQLYKLSPGRAVSFLPNRWHSVTPFSGSRLVLTAYAVPTMGKLTQAQESRLLQAGFPFQAVRALNSHSPHNPVQPQDPNPDILPEQKAICVRHSQGESLPSENCGSRVKEGFESEKWGDAVGKGPQGELDIHPADVIALSQIRLSAVRAADGGVKEHDPARVPGGLERLFEEATQDGGGGIQGSRCLRLRLLMRVC